MTRLDFTETIACDKQKDEPSCTKSFATLIQLGSYLNLNSNTQE